MIPCRDHLHDRHNPIDRDKFGGGKQPGPADRMCTRIGAESADEYQPRATPWVLERVKTARPEGAQVIPISCNLVGLLRPFRAA
jgi:hypothetical protein